MRSTATIVCEAASAKSRTGTGPTYSTASSSLALQTAEGTSGDANNGELTLKGLHRWYASAAIASGAVFTVFLFRGYFRAVGVKHWLLAAVPVGDGAAGRPVAVAACFDGCVLSSFLHPLLCRCVAADVAGAAGWGLFRPQPADAGAARRGPLGAAACGVLGYPAGRCRIVHANCHSKDVA